MTSVRKLEAQAIRTLVNLHDPDTAPHEWRPEHFDEAEAAASMLSGLLRRHEAAVDRARTRAASAPDRRPQRKPEPPELARSRRIVTERSGGRCEARVSPEVCTGQAIHVHHRRGRVGQGVHRPERLLHVCAECHSHIHAHPEEAYAQGWLERKNGAIQ